MPPNQNQTAATNANASNGTAYTRNARGRYVTRAQFDVLFNIMIGVIVVLFVGFLALIMDYMNNSSQAQTERARSYDSLKAQYDLQAEKISELKLEMQDMKNSLSSAIDKKMDKK